jgi:hypothetical protein
MDRRQFIKAGGAAALSCSPISLGLTQTSWTPPYALPAAGQAITLTAPGGNTLRAVATAANGWGDYSWSVALGAPIYNGNGFGAFAEDYSTAGAMVIAGSGGHHAGGIWGGFIFDFTTGQWISKANANGKIETFADPDDTLVDWSTGELKDKTGLIGQLPIPGHGYIWPFCPPKAIAGGTKGYYIKPCVVAGADAGYDAARSFQFDLDTGLWTYASDNNMNFDGKYLNPYTDGGGDWDPVTNRYYTTQKGPYTGELRYLERTATGWTWRKTACPNLRNATLFTVFVHGRELVIGYKDATWQKVDLDNAGAGATYINVVNASLAAGFYQRWHKYPVDGCWYTLKGRADRAAITSYPNDGSPISTLAVDQFLLKLDPTTWTITQVPIAGGILALWESRYTATHPHGNAFIYVPKLECFAWFPRHDGPVQLIKPPGGATGADRLPPTVPSNLRVVTATTSSITWAWDASTDSGGGTVAGYRVGLFDSSDVPVGSLVDAGNVLTYTAGGLIAGATYKLRVSAYDNASPVNESALCIAVAGSTSAPGDSQPPTVPANLRVASVSASSITWTWDASTDSGGGFVAGYRVALFDGAGVAIGAPANAGNVLTYTANGLTAATTYQARVSAYDDAVPANESAFCPAVAASTSGGTPADTQPPSIPTNLRFVAATASSITWAWDAATDYGGGSVAGYKIALYTTNDAPIGGPVDVGNVLAYAAAGLTAGTTYKLRVSAYDNATPANESGFSTAVAAATSAASDTLPPSVPATLRVQAITSTSITWAWSASIDAGGGSVAGYTLALYDNADVPIGGPINVGNLLAYTTSGLGPNTTYKVRVSAYDNAVPPNESAFCAPVAGVTSAAADSQPPTVPTNLRVTTKTTSSLAWAWNASTDMGGGRVAGYKVVLYDGNDVQLGGLVDVGNVLAYVAGALNANTTYKLRVSAYDDALPANQSSLCAPVAATTRKKDPGKGGS